MRPSVEQGALFDAPDLPHGLVYRPDFLTTAEESALLASIRDLPFREATYQKYLARRRIVMFGSEHDEQYDRWTPASTVPPWLEALQAKVAHWVDVAPAAFVHALVTEYRPGTPIGWHRDAPHYGFVVGISLASACRMRFRPLDDSDRRRTVAIDLEARSAYVMQRTIRWGWQHSIPPTRALRYSVTLRTRADGVREPGPRFAP
jgi:alkylated DNA repair dioxygenase AlkB